MGNYDDYLWLTAENADAGQRNGSKIGNLAETSNRPITRYESTHNDVTAKRLKPEEFKGLRTVTHLAVGAPTMLTCNKMYGVETVLLGLMNGARGEVMGFRHSAESAPPALPEYVAVNFPTYTGDPIFRGEGREKWAPVPFIEAFGKTRKYLARSGMPLLLC